MDATLLAAELPAHAHQEDREPATTAPSLLSAESSSSSWCAAADRRRSLLFAAVRGVSTAVLVYLCLGELLPPPLTSRFTNYVGLPRWAVQQPVLLAVLCALPATSIAVARPSTPSAETKQCCSLGEDDSGSSRRRVFAVVHLAPLGASVLAALWRMESDNCPRPAAAEENQGAPALCGVLEVAIDALGLMAARCARLDLALCLLPAAKQSMWLVVLGGAPDEHDYSSAMPLHRIAGFWCAAMSGLHSLAYLLFYLRVQPGGLHGVWINCFPVPLPTHLNSLGLVNWMGVVAAVVCLVLAVMALPPLRRQRYHLFQRWHLLLALLFVGCGALHDLQILFFALPGLASWYLCATTDAGGGCERRAIHRQLSTTARPLPGTSNNWIELTVAVSSPLAGSLPSGGGDDFSVASMGNGGRGHWISLRVPTLMGQEWHPFSVAALDWPKTGGEGGLPGGGATLSVVISTGRGDWSRKLGHLVAEGGVAAAAHDDESGALVKEPADAASFEVDVLGPFEAGGGWSLWGSGGGGGGGNQSESGTPGHLLLVAGGTGITGWLPGLQARSGMLSTCRSGMPPLRLIWCVQTESDYSALCARVPRSTRPEDQVIVYVTRGGIGIGTQPAEGDGVPPLGPTFGQRTQTGTLRPPLQPSEIGPSSVGGSDPHLIALPFSVIAGLLVGYWGWKIHRPGDSDDNGWAGLAHYTAMRRCLPVLAILAIVTITASIGRRMARHWHKRRHSQQHRVVTLIGPEESQPEVDAQSQVGAPHQLCHGRPDLIALIAESAAAAGGSRLTVVACGPTGLVQAAQGAAKTVASNPEYSIHFVGADPDW
eukprot:COSAG01_NODE_1316_length_10755_cov_4.749343_7_plen_825_part_00